MRCSICIYWDRQTGQCRRRAPVLFRLNSDVVLRWPWTSEREDCGEGKVRHGETDEGEGKENP